MKVPAKSGPLQHALIYIRSSLWFVPGLIILSGMALAIGLVELDRHIADEVRRQWPNLFATEPEGARSMLSTIAGSMATVMGVAFSITIVALVLASTQYTSRVMRNFMRDRANQIVLGIFVGVYIYCLMVLRTIGGDDGNFVPSTAVLGALILAIFSSGAFIFFIHHISSTIQASEMAEAITRETLEAIDLLFPNALDHASDEAVIPELQPGTNWQPIAATKMGYVQGVDPDGLVAFAREHNTIVRMECGIGEFVSQDQALASLALGSAPNADIIKGLNKLYAIDSYRTIDQDAAFGIRQLVDMSLKALSPGINDTTTAVTCIEHLTVLLSRCVNRRNVDLHRFDSTALRVILRRRDFSDLLKLSFNQILENAEGNTEVMLRLLIGLERIGIVAVACERVIALGRQVDTLEEISMRSAKSTAARDEINAYIRRVRDVLAEAMQRHA